MSIAYEPSQVFHRATEQIFALLSAKQMRQIAELRGDPVIVDRLVELAEKANEDELTDSERSEYEAYIEANNLLAVLQAEARLRLADSES